MFFFTVAVRLFSMRGHRRENPVSNLACVAGGSGCARETFCGEAVNFIAGFAREGIFASGKI